MSSKMEDVITIELTDNQIKRLSKITDRVDDAFFDGERGIAIGQLWVRPADVGKVKFGFLPFKDAARVAHIIYPDP